jgi:hypothetical protein
MLILSFEFSTAAELTFLKALINAQVISSIEILRSTFCMHFLFPQAVLYVPSTLRFKSAHNFLRRNSFFLQSYSVSTQVQMSSLSTIFSSSVDLWFLQLETMFHDHKSKGRKLKVPRHGSFQRHQLLHCSTPIQRVAKAKAGGYTRLGSKLGNKQLRNRIPDVNSTPYNEGVKEINEEGRK